MSKEKLARRKAMGDDPTAMSKSNSSEAGSIPSQNYGRPNPNADQKNNVDLNPMNSQSMGGGLPTSGSFTGQNMYPYNDGGIPSTGGAMGSVGFAKPSNEFQVRTPGQMLNSKYKYGEIAGPPDETGRRMEPYYMQQQSAERAQKLYGAGQMPSYEVSLMGPLGTRVEVGRPTPGQYPPSMPQQSDNYLGLQGTPDVSQSSGMDTGTGGRNKMKKDKGAA